MQNMQEVEQPKMLRATLKEYQLKGLRQVHRSPRHISFHRRCQHSHLPTSSLCSFSLPYCAAGFQTCISRASTAFLPMRWAWARPFSPSLRWPTSQRCVDFCNSAALCDFPPPLSSTLMLGVPCVSCAPNHKHAARRYLGPVSGSNTGIDAAQLVLRAAAIYAGSSRHPLLVLMMQRPLALSRCLLYPYSGSGPALLRRAHIQHCRPTKFHRGTVPERRVIRGFWNESRMYTKDADFHVMVRFGE